MKRFFMVAFVSLVTLYCSVGAAAQSGLVVSGGLNFSTSEFKEISNENVTNFHFGLGYKWDMALGFSFQPTLLYSVKGAVVGNKVGNVDLSVGYLELMPSLQWGPDLLLFRPFIDVSPYIGYGLNTKVSLPALEEVLNKFEYGAGLGFGLEVWRLQVICRYNWNFGNFMSAVHGDSVFNESSLSDAFDKSRMGGLTLTASIVF